MISILIWLASIATYIVIGSWTFGYICGKWSAESKVVGYDREPSYWYDEPPPYFGGAFWPIYLLFAVILFELVHIGETTAMTNFKVRRVRVELEKKIRVEQERIQEEAEQEIEKVLRQTSAA